MSGDALPVCSYGRALHFGAGLFCCRWFEPRPEVREKTVYFGLFGW